MTSRRPYCCMSKFEIVLKNEPTKSKLLSSYRGWLVVPRNLQKNIFRKQLLFGRVANVNLCHWFVLLIEGSSSSRLMVAARFRLPIYPFFGFLKHFFGLLKIIIMNHIFPVPICTVTPARRGGHNLCALLGSVSFLAFADDGWLVANPLCDLEISWGPHH